MELTLDIILWSNLMEAIVGSYEAWFLLTVSDSLISVAPLYPTLIPIAKVSYESDDFFPIISITHHS